MLIQPPLTHQAFKHLLLPLIARSLLDSTSHVLTPVEEIFCSKWRILGWKVMMLINVCFQSLIVCEPILIILCHSSHTDSPKQIFCNYLVIYHTIIEALSNTEGCHERTLGRLCCLRLVTEQLDTIAYSLCIILSKRKKYGQFIL